jgi:hypothetical protein
MQPSADETIDDNAQEFDDALFDIFEDDSEIDGDCNESQPCRGDEPGLEHDLD